MQCKSQIKASAKCINVNKCNGFGPSFNVSLWDPYAHYISFTNMTVENSRWWHMATKLVTSVVCHSV